MKIKDAGSNLRMTIINKDKLLFFSFLWEKNNKTHTKKQKILEQLLVDFQDWVSCKSWKLDHLYSLIEEAQAGV